MWEEWQKRKQSSRKEARFLSITKPVYIVGRCCITLEQKKKKSIFRAVKARALLASWRLVKNLFRKAQWGIQHNTQGDSLNALHRKPFLWQLSVSEHVTWGVKLFQKDLWLHKDHHCVHPLQANHVSSSTLSFLLLLLSSCFDSSQQTAGSWVRRWLLPLSVMWSGLLFDRVRLTKKVARHQGKKMKKTLTLETASAVRMKDKLEIHVNDQTRHKLDKRWD